MITSSIRLQLYLSHKFSILSSSSQAPYFTACTTKIFPNMMQKIILYYIISMCWRDQMSVQVQKYEVTPSKLFQLHPTWSQLTYRTHPIQSKKQVTINRTFMFPYACQNSEGKAKYYTEKYCKDLFTQKLSHLNQLQLQTTLNLRLWL